MDHPNNGSWLPLDFMQHAWKRNACLAFIAGRNAFFYHQLLRHHLSKRDKDAARALLHHALWHFPHSATLHLRHVHLSLLNRTDVTASLESAQKYAEMEGLDETALYRAEAYVRLGKTEEALNLVTGLLAEADGVVQLRRRAGTSIRFPEAGALPELWADAAETPYQPGVFKKLWFYTELHQNFEESLVKYQDLLENHPYCCYAWFNLGLTFVAIGRWQEALDALEYAFITEPEYLEAYREMADLAIRHAQWSRGLEACLALTGQLGPQAGVLVLTGVCLAGLNRRQEAQLVCNQALNLDPRCAEAHYRLGLMAAEEQIWQKAELHLRRALRLDGEHAGFYGALAEVFYRQGQHKAACRHAWKAVGLAPEEAVNWRRLSDMLWRAGKRKEALDVLDQSIIHCECVELLYGRAACLFGLGRRNNALRQLRQALRSDYRQHTLLFDWLPSLQHDPGVQTLLTGFRDRANSL